MFFFFQAEDGIRDNRLTGFQTCALPIKTTPPPPAPDIRRSSTARAPAAPQRHAVLRRARAKWPSARRRRPALRSPRCERSEERRVGKECRSRWAPYQLKKKKTIEQKR